MSKRIRKIVSGAAIGLLIPAFAFWWYEWRPYEIRQGCIAVANEQIKATPVSLESADAIRVYYEMCLHARGLDK